MNKRLCNRMVGLVSVSLVLCLLVTLLPACASSRPRVLAVQTTVSGAQAQSGPTFLVRFGESARELLRGIRSLGERVPLLNVATSSSASSANTSTQTAPTLLPVPAVSALLPDPSPTPSPDAAPQSIETVTAIVTPDKEALLSSSDGSVTVRLPAGSFAEEVRAELTIRPPPSSTGMRVVKLLELNAYATRRQDEKVTALQKEAVITIRNSPKQLEGLNLESLRLYYLDDGDSRWKPIASQFDAASMTLTSSTSHFSYYGEQADPIISGPAIIMAFEADLHSGTVKYNYPIELPPGRGGFKPRLTLVYDSGRADGMKNKRSLGSWVGIGWSLDPGYITYDDEANEYYLEIGGEGYEMFRSGNSYFIKPDLFYKIVRDEANQKWEVWDRSGIYYRFGGTTDSQQYYDKNGTPLYHRWNVDLIKDTHGNQVTITYQRYIFGSSVRSAYPTQMSYNNGLVTVTFNSSYDENNPNDGSVRKDNPISTPYVSVPKVMENRKLDDLLVLVNGFIVRKYVFSYTTTDRVYSSDYGGIYYSGKHKLSSVTLKGADGVSAMPALSFTYQDLETYFRDADNSPYTGNPGNPASLSWPHLVSVNNGYGATISFSYSQKPDNTTANIWTRQVVMSKTVNPGIGPNQTYTYDYDGNPQYLGYSWTARYRGFNKVKETDAAGSYTWHWYHTTGYVSGKDWEKVTGLEYRTQQYDSSNNLVQDITNDWDWNTSFFWDSTNPEYTFLTKWDGYSSNDGYFSDPMDVAVDSSGNVYVTDSSNNRVQKFDNSGSFLTRWGGTFGAENNQFKNPYGIAVDSNGKVYVADTGNGRVQKFQSYGAFDLSWSTGGMVSGVAVSPDGNNVYVTNLASDQVEEYTNTGTFVRSWGGSGTGDGQFDSPNGIATDSSGNVYVADTSNHRIQKYTSTGTFLGWFGRGTSTTGWHAPGSGETGVSGSGDGQFSGPYGVALYTSVPSYIYVADNGNHRIQKFDSSAAFLGWFGKGTSTTGWHAPGSGETGVVGSGNGEFSSPKGVTAQSGSYVFVGDTGNHRIQKFDTAGSYQAKWGSYSEGSGQFANPVDTAQVGDAVVYILDQSAMGEQGGNEVKKFDTDGGYSLKFGGYGTGDGKFNSPSGLGVSPDGNDVYVADTGNHRVQKFASDGTLQGWFGKGTSTTGWHAPGSGETGVSGSGSGQFNQPYDVAVSPDGLYIYVVDKLNHRIQVFDSSGIYVTQWGSYGPGDFQFNEPTGVAVDSTGYVYVADSLNHRVKKFNESGTLQGWFGKGTSTTGWHDPGSGETGLADSGDGQFNTPMRVAADSSAPSYIYVADTGNHRIQKFDSSGSFMTKFGLQGSDNGQFSSPQGIDVSSEGSFMYVADSGNDRVQKISWLWHVTLDQTDVTQGTKTARTVYANDDRGNVAMVQKVGDTGASGDESTIWRAFTSNLDSGKWILDKTSRERVYSGIKDTDDGGAGIKTETRYFYDGHASYTDPPDEGDLTKVERYDPATQTTISTQKAYDTYGNVTSETDARNETTSYTYDATYHTFVVTKTLPAVGDNPAMSESYTWNYTGARMTSETDVNGQTTSYEYDTFWRPVKPIRPGDSSNSPTIQHQYNNWGTINQQHIYTSQKLNDSDSLWRKRYFDGLGRVVQVQAEGETGRTIVTTTAYNNRGLVDKEYVAQDLDSATLNGYKAPEASWKYTSYAYDTLKRVTTKTAADGTSVSHAYTDWQDEVTNERSLKKRYYYDAFARLSKVEELDDSFAVYATTTYQYDVLGNLTEVKDNANNTTTMDYDGFSRKTSMTDPDMGAWSYVYDDNGNLTSQTDAKSQTITFDYDELNRMTAKKQGGTPFAIFTYDSTAGGNLGKGRLTGMSDASGDMAYKYDTRGRLAEEKRTVDSTDYTTGYTYYGSTDLLETVTYPTGEVATQSYTPRLLPDGLSSSASGTIVFSTLYNNLGLTTEMNLGNDTRTTYGYWDMGGAYDNSGDYYGKLWEIKTVKDPSGSPVTLQDVKHTWDASGNLTQRENAVDAETESFGYDFLDRLTSSNNYLFSFDSVSLPWKATVDGSGNVLVADTGYNRIAKFDADGNFLSSFGSSGSGDGQFSYPSGVTVDSSGNIYVSDYFNYRVQKFDSSGTFLGWFGRGTSTTGWHAPGSDETGVSGSGDGQFNKPTDVVYNSYNGYIYVVEQSNNRVQYFDTSGSFQGKWGSSGSGDGQFWWPQGIGVDSSGNIYVADTLRNRIQKFNSTGTFQAKWGSLGSGDGQFAAPCDVTLDSAGSMFIAERDNNRVQKLSPSGTFITKWSTYPSGQLNGPYGVALSSTRIYVVDKGNSRLRAYDLATTVGWAYNQLGNITYRDGVAYTYGTRPHAVTQAGSTSYVYDDNGDMTTRGGQTLTWDVENRLTGVTGAATFEYDGNGFRVKKTEGGQTTFYANQYYERNLTTGVTTLYYYLGGKLVAYKEGTDLRYVAQDHLTGTSVTTDSSGNSIGSINYKPYGETRSASGTLPDQKFTGQRLDGTGLYYYGARYYDPALARFVSADTIVPKPANPQSLNRYSYVLNNPLKYVDPTGHLVEGSIPWRFPGSTEQVWVSSSMLSIPGWAAANPDVAFALGVRFGDLGGGLNSPGKKPPRPPGPTPPQPPEPWDREPQSPSTVAAEQDAAAASASGTLAAVGDTNGGGFNVNLGIGGGVSFSGMVVQDDERNTAVVISFGGGGYAGVGFSVTAQAQHTTAHSVEDLGGLSTVVGGTAGAGAVTGAEWVVGASSAQYQGYNTQTGYGWNFLGPVPVEMHGFLEYAWVIRMPSWWPF